MVNAVALFHRGNRMKHRTGSTTVMLLALMVCGQAEAHRPKTFIIRPSVAFESNQLRDRDIDAQLSEDDDCRAFLIYHDECAPTVLPDEYDDGISRRRLRSKSTQLTGEALGAYCRDLHMLWKQQWAEQCPADEDEGT
ncbi:MULTISPECIES: hypothetical protein [Stenotrophomonas]|jgi:hypothetical protein|nr:MULTISPECIES: hypothetical protein [Stenotrophomonas]SSM89860.1 Uncharacterised protein [Acinetobacter baumannii]MCI1140852.1 hypothetical protein [Stenotrophomonas maltophilia]MCO7475079.1 hypothetical protein [Stenotrophomonas maltophilia]MCO7480788.1 hypothetical protein [Stenotrophomonas maltophilia]MDG9911717.1 hypothetical protein [Stenotrophomonas maltophilia]